MITVERIQDLTPHVGQELGVSDWVRIDGEAIRSFGQITGDTHWVHMDADRARRETPFGGSIVHGFFVLALTTGLANQCYSVRRASRWLNYGVDRVRFTAIVTAGSRVRLRLTLIEIEAQRAGTRLRLGCTIELEGSERPAAVADWICIAFDEEEA